MIRVEILESLNQEERRELHSLIIDARQYRYETKSSASYDEAARLESVLIKVRKNKRDFG